MDIQNINIDDLIPYARNSRTHSQEQVAQIASSITEFGFNNPVLLDGSKGIIAGHGRVQAARKLGMDTVPCIELAHLTDTQKRAYIIADNKLALNAGWDDDFLRIELEEIHAEGLAINLTGFSFEDICLVDEVGLPAFPDGDKEPFQQMTFTLHDEQAEQVRQAVEVAKGMGTFIGSKNENGNGNALARICETFITQNG